MEGRRRNGNVLGTSRYDEDEGRRLPPEAKQPFERSTTGTSSGFSSRTSRIAARLRIIWQPKLLNENGGLTIKVR